MAVLDKTNTVTLLDKATGEPIDTVIDVKSNTIRTDEPPYVKMYIAAWVAIYADGARVNTALLSLMLPYMTPAHMGAEPAGQVIQINTFTRRQIQNKLGISRTGMYNDIKALETSNIIKRLDTNTWLVNPSLIGRGSWSDVKSLRIAYEIELNKGQVTDAKARRETELNSGVIDVDQPHLKDKDKES